MSTFDDPNREAVGLDPIWTEPAPGDDEPEAEKAEPEPEPEPKAEPRGKADHKAK